MMAPSGFRFAFALVLAALAGTGLDAQAKRFDTKSVPFTFDYDEAYRPEVASYKGAITVALMDYAEDDFFRAVKLQLTRRPKKAETLEAEARSFIEGMQKATAFERVKVVSMEAARIEKLPALRLRATYRLVGGRESFVRPDGEERHTGDAPLDMSLEMLFVSDGGSVLELMSDVSRAQAAKRGPHFQKVLSTFKLREKR